MRRKSNWPRFRGRHPVSSLRHLIQWAVIVAAGVSLAATAVFAGGTAPTCRGAQREKGAQANLFLLFGTVFTEKGFALPGAEVEVRRAGEKKIRWRALSDRSGEFAVRVPPGAEYEVTVRAKDFDEQTHKVDATSGTREDIVFRMKAAARGKKK